MNNNGSVILKVIMLMGLVNGAALYNNYRNKARANQDIKLIQAKIIDDTIKEVHQVLANIEKCALARPSFQSIEGFDNLPKMLSDNDSGRISLKSIVKVPDPQALSPREYLLELTFEKYTTNKVVPLSITKTVRVLDFIIDDEGSAAGKDVCTSYETDAHEDIIEIYCDLTASEIDDDKGRCKYDQLLDSPFKTRLYALACETLGGAFSDDKCDRVNIDGTIQTSNLKINQIELRGTKRTDFLDSYCNATGEVPTGINEDSSVKGCTPLPCDNPGTGLSTWAIVETEEAFNCKCLRDRPNNPNQLPNFECGASDPNSCDDYLVDDGCGTNTSCTIRGTKNCQIVSGGGGANQTGCVGTLRRWGSGQRCGYDLPGGTPGQTMNVNSNIWQTSGSATFECRDAGGTPSWSFVSGTCN